MPCSHARAIAETNGTELVAICVKSDSSRDKAKADFPGIAVYADYRELVAREDIDAVDIVLPTFLHYEVALAALELGKHLLLEKPVALVQRERLLMGFGLIVLACIQKLTGRISIEICLRRNSLESKGVTLMNGCERSRGMVRCLVPISAMRRD